MTSLRAFQKPTVHRQTLLKNGNGRQRGFGRQGSAQRARAVKQVLHRISGPKVSTHPTGRKIERFCGVAEGPEVLFTLARPAE